MKTKVIISSCGIFFAFVMFLLPGCNSGDDDEKAEQDAQLGGEDGGTENDDNDIDSGEDDDATPAGDDDNDAGNYDAGQSTELPADFFDKISEKSATLEFKGLINTADDLLAGQITPGAGEFKINISSGEEVIEESVYSYANTLPEDYKEESLRGKTILQIAGSKLLEGTNTQARYHYINATFLVDDLKKYKEENMALIQGEPFRIGYYDWEINLRKDNVQLDKICPLAYPDTKNQSSRVFIDFSDNTEFAAGEYFKVSENIAVSDDIEALANSYPNYEEFDGLYCLFRVGGVDVTKEKYVEELNKDTAVLSCELPEDALTPPEDNFAVFTFTGELNEEGVQYPRYGIVDYTVIIDGQNYLKSFYDTYAYSMNYDGVGEIVYVEANGDIEQIEQSRYLYTSLTMILSKEAMMQAKGEGKVELATDAMVEAYVNRVESITGGAESLVMLCPIGVVDKNDASSLFFLCSEANVEFAAGEKFELAGNLKLTTEKAAFGQYFNFVGDEECVCYKDQQQFDCAEFPPRTN